MARSQRRGGEKGKRTFGDEGQRAWRRGWRKLGGAFEDADTWAVKTMTIKALLTKYLGPKTFQSSILLSMETQGGKIERTSKEIGWNAGSGQKSGFIIKKRTPLSLSPFFSILSSFPSEGWINLLFHFIFYQGDVMIYERFGFHSFYISLNVYRHMN